VTVPVFLWNVFPFHPHEPGHPFTNRSHNPRERAAGEAVLAELILLLKPRCIVGIGNDAAKTASCLRGSEEIAQIRHPSYGGQREFEQQATKKTPRSGHVSLDEAEHFPAQSSCQRRYAPMVFGISPECRSDSVRN
jgi:hypothetical protein